LLALVITLAASAQVNLVGYWNPIFDEDWLERIPGPDVDDYAGLPITAAAQAGEYVGGVASDASRSASRRQNSPASSRTTLHDSAKLSALLWLMREGRVFSAVENCG
jgi:hypothetical protein